MTSATTAFLLAALVALGASMAREDYATTRVAVWKLMAFAALAALWAIWSGGLAENRLESALGSLIATMTGAAAGFVVGKRKGRDAFGGADVWILGAGGALLGLQWVGPWIGLAVIAGVGAFLRGARPDPESDDATPILPFVPVLLATLAALAAGRLAGLLPSQPF